MKASEKFEYQRFADIKRLLFIEQKDNRKAQADFEKILTVEPVSHAKYFFSF